ncbi:MAG: hypothetical protein WAW02_15055 [Sideroxyarcus sp.]
MNTDATRINNRVSSNFAYTIQVSCNRHVTHRFICINPCSSVAEFLRFISLLKKSGTREDARKLEEKLESGRRGSLDRSRLLISKRHANARLMLIHKE